MGKYMFKTENPIPWKAEIIKALDVIEDALEEYDEIYGLAFSDIPEKFRDLQNFFMEICYPKEVEG